MASLAGVTKEDDKEIARKMFRAGDVNKQVDDVSSLFFIRRNPVMKGGIMQCTKWNRLWSKRCVQRAVSAGKSQVVLFWLVIGWDWHVIFEPITLRSGKNHCWLAFVLLFLTAPDRTKSAYVGCQPRTNGDGRDLFGSWSWYKCCRRSKRAYLFLVHCLNG